MTGAATEPSEFGAILQRLRRRAGLSQHELAERAGLSLRGIADLERGVRRTPYPATVRRLADALGLSGLERDRFVVAAWGEADVDVGPGETPSARVPKVLSTLIGRELEMRRARGILDTTRLLTLTGAGGVGKTRLALAVLGDVESAGEAEPVFVDLAPLEDSDLVTQKVASAMGVRDQPGRSVLATLIDAIHSRHLLLVLDNCEHLLDACARLAHELLQNCPNLRILATSRERLDVEGETVWRVPSLPVPEPEAAPGQIEASAGVRLFLTRARELVPSLELNHQNLRAAAEICRRLDGIPLALELAAAQVPILSPEQIASRLDDALGLLTRGRRLAPARQQTVRAMLDWSYGLLTEPERLLLDRLAVFAGGWSLEAAEQVAGCDGLQSATVLALLGRLTDTSLVLVDRKPGEGVRYRLLETVRQYGLERLAARDEIARARNRHADFFLAFAERTEPALWDHRGVAAQIELEHERDNCRAALGWLVEQGDPERAQRLAGALGRFWFYRGYLVEGEVWTRRILGLPEADRPSSGRAKTLFTLGIVAFARGDYALVETTMREVRHLWRALGNAGEEGFALFVLGLVARLQGDLAAARAFLEEGVLRARAGDQPAAEMNGQWALAEVAFDEGRTDEARALAETVLARATETGWLIAVTVARRLLGSVHIRQGDYPAARAMLDASLSEARALGARWWMAETMAQLGQLALAQGDAAGAARWYSESLGLARDLADRAGIARAVEGIAQLAVDRKAPREALQLAAAAASLRASMHAPLAPHEQARLEQRLSSARRMLGEAAARAALAHGRQLTLQQAVDLGLEHARGDAEKSLADRSRVPLTRRELAVAQLIAEGLTNRQIAERLVIAEGTAERHVGNILAKLDMTTRAQVAAWAVAAGIVQAPGGVRLRHRGPELPAGIQDFLHASQARPADDDPQARA